MSDAYGRLVDLIYEAVISPSAWSDVLTGVSDYVSAGSINLGSLDIVSGEGSLIAPRADPVRVKEYFDHYTHINPILIPDSPDKYVEDWDLRILTDEEMIDRDQLIRTEYFNDYLAPGGIDRTAAIRLSLSGRRLSSISIGRGRRWGPFSAAEREGLGRLQPHLVRAFHMSQQFAQAGPSLESLLNASVLVRDALILVDAAGTILSKNATAEALFVEGEDLHARNGVLSAVHVDDDRVLQRLIGSATNLESEARSSGGLSMKRGRGAGLSLTVCPVSSSALSVFSRRAAALVCVRMPQAPRDPPSAVLKRRFDLTEGEVRVALALFEGLTIDHTAVRLGVSRNTVRAQLGAIFGKTSTHRQAELVLLLASILDE